MARSTASASIISLNDVRDSVKRVQSEGERLVTRIRGEGERVADRVRREAEGVVDRARREARRLMDAPLPAPLDAVRRQAEQVVAEVQKRRAALAKDVQKRRTAVTADLRKRADQMAGRITRSLGAADADRVKKLSRDVTGLELRVSELERRLVEVMAEVKAKRKDTNKDAAA
jgi:hypothetical protein